MENRTTQEIVLNLLKTKDSMEKIQKFPSKSIKRANTLDSAVKSRVEDLKSKSKAYSQLEEVHNLKGNPHAAGGLLSSLLKPNRRQPATALSSAASSKPAAAFCVNCGTKLTPGAAFCPNCGTKTR